MNRSVMFDSPFLLGFESTRALVERAAKAAESYPPYNVEDRGEGRLRITLAVAGFTPEQLEVTLEDRGRRALSNHFYRSEINSTAQGQKPA